MTPEQIKQIAIECGAIIMDWDDGHMLGEGDAILSEEQLQAFFTRAYELGWKNRGESDAKVCKKLADTFLMQAKISTAYLHKQAACCDCESAIRNNTGE